MDSFHQRGAMPDGPMRLPRTVDLTGLPDDLGWALSYRPGVGYMVGIYYARDGLLDGGSHATPQAAVSEALLFARAHRLFAGPAQGGTPVPDCPYGAMPDPEADPPAGGPPVDYGPRLGWALRLVLAGLALAGLIWQFRS